MKILVITQKVDREDGALGFMHQWLAKISEQVEVLNVVCLEQGSVSLSENVRVFSLGKEQSQSRIKYLVRFYKYVFKLRKEYDVVFCHMNPVYIVLAGGFWKIWRKKVFLWHNHKQGTLMTRKAIWLANRVFYTSSFSFSSRFKKAKQMPVGIDTNVFKKDEAEIKAENSLLYLGRISPVKKIEVLIKAAKLLAEQGREFALNIVGEPGQKDSQYFEKIKKAGAELIAKGKARFYPAVPNYQTPKVYNQNEVFVNLTPSGSFDKTILEAMACRTLVIVCNQSLKGLLSDELIFKEGDSQDLKDKINNLLAKPAEEKRELGEQLRRVVIEKHSLDLLVNKLVDEFKRV